MRKLYLIGSIIVFLLILMLNLPQFGAMGCQWVLIRPQTMPAVVLFQATGLGIVLGGLMALFWKTPKEDEMGDEEGGDDK